MQRLALLVFMLIVAQMVSTALPRAALAQERDAFDPASFSIDLQPVVNGLERPVYVTAAPDGTTRMFVVEQPGQIRLIVDGEVLATPFLDMTPLVESSGSEQGLLSIAFPPYFAESGLFYVYYTARSGEGVGDNTIARYRVSADDPNRADPESGEILIAVPDSRRNHNGGHLLFGPDGYLYAGLGDGGSGGDPDGNGQNPATFLGSLLRIDPLPDGGYAIPGDNPFANSDDGTPEVWAWGLRNPWRFSFDRETGDLYIADVGQNAIEEIDFLPAGSPGGTNFGWSVMEGTTCYQETSCDTSGLTLPVAEYTHEFGCSVTGGYVYRGALEPKLEGVYLFGDFCSGLVWGMGRDASGSWVVSDPVETGLRISSFGEDAEGELYLVAISGEIFRIAAG
jgi:glucose/arabinose dehydrogenase